MPITPEQADAAQAAGEAAIEELYALEEAEGYCLCVTHIVAAVLEAAAPILTGDTP